MKRLIRLLTLLSAVLAVLCLILIASSYLLVPRIAATIIGEQAGKALHTKVSVDRVTLDPWHLKAVISGVRIETPEGRVPLLTLEAIEADVSASSLFKRAVVIESLSIRHPVLHLVRDRPSHYNFSWLLSLPHPQKNASGEATPFSIANITLTQGRILFDDRVGRTRHAVEGIAIALPFVSTIPYLEEIFVTPSVAATVDGAAFVLNGATKPFSASKQSYLTLALRGVDLNKLAGYLPDERIETLHGILDIDGTLAFAVDASGKPASRIETTAGLRGFETAYEGRRIAAQRIALERAFVDVTAGKAGFDALVAVSPSLVASQRTITFNAQTITLKYLDADFVQRRAALAAIFVPGIVATSTGSTLRGALRVDMADADLDKNLYGAQQIALDGISLSLPSSKPGTMFEGKASSLLVHRMLADTAAVSLEDMALNDARVSLGGLKSSLASIDALTITSPRIDLSRHALTLTRLLLDGGRLALTRQRDGTIPWLAYLPKAQTQAHRASPGRTPAWSAASDETVVRKLVIDVDDASLLKPLKTAVTIESLALRNLRSDETSAFFDYHAAASLSEGGSAQADGKATLAGRAEGTIVLRNLPLPLINHVVALPPKLDFYRGLGDLAGTMTVLPGGDAPTVGFRGKCAVSGLDLRSRVDNRTVASWKMLALNGIDLSTATRQLTVEGIALSDFGAVVDIDRNGTLNWNTLLAMPASVRSDPATAPSPTPPYRMTIDAITLQNGAVDIRDGKVRPPYAAKLEKITGRVSRLVLDSQQNATVELLGRINSYGKIAIDGNITPSSDRFALNLAAKSSDIAMKQFDPYSGKFLGYKIGGGSLGMDLHYDIHGKNLTATNLINLDQFDFGDEVESPDAVHLPVRFAVSLLKDSNGKMTIDLPVEGTTDDPSFRSGKIIWTMIFNFLKKLITAPFSVLGSLFGGGADSGYIAFDPGSADMPEGGSAKLSTVASLLASRPSLKLDIAGSYDIKADTAGIKQEIFDLKIKHQKALVIEKEKGIYPDLASVNVTSAEYPTYLKKAYKEETFPKPKIAFLIEKDLPVDEMEKLMMTHIDVTAAMLDNLARRRAEGIYNRLIEETGIPAERLSASVKGGNTAEKLPGARIDFDLKTK